MAVTYPERLGDAISYLEAVAAGLRHCRSGELSVRLVEIGRNIQSMAYSAQIAEESANLKAPDCLAPGYENEPPVFAINGEPFDPDDD